ncbi:MAG: undecaprenyl-phosphate glucose phosphotransferase [Rhizobiales bacterium]|nr:undecaprenyl-phosphate glucose phosphotransferase [Hyphomicrobiales bacterium]
MQGTGVESAETFGQHIGQGAAPSAVADMMKSMPPQFGSPGVVTERASQQVLADLCAAFDFLTVLACAIVAKYFYIDAYLDRATPLPEYLIIGLIGASVATFILRRQGAYSIDVLGSTRGYVRRALIAILVAAFFLFGVGYFLKMSQSYSRGWIISWFALSFLVLIANRFLTSLYLKRWISKGIFAKQVAIFGSGMIAKYLLTHLRQDTSRMNVVGVFDDAYGSTTSAVPASGGLSELIRLAQRTRIDEVVIALPLSETQRIEKLFAELSILPSAISLCPDIVAFRLRPKRMVDHNGVMLMELAGRPLDDWSPIIKSLEDKIIAGLLLTFAAPLMILIAAMIKLDSPGPFFFRQRRHGFNHEVISVLKFRTMRVAEDGPQVTQAQKNDPRVTRVGRFLRRTSLDELPQLINVLMGTMSLVGPRPHALAHNEYYAATLERYAARHKVKPGITGWAQINGFRGETDTPEKMRKRVEYDLYYIENWSIWLDIKIILLTPFLGLIGKNAF